MDLVNLVSSAVVGLFGGAAGGVLTAGEISRRSELARQRLTARRRLTELVNCYRATIRFDHDQLYETSRFSEDYGSIEGQEAFAVAILRALEPIDSRTAQRLRTELLALVGDLRFKLAEQRAWLPDERLDADRESKRQSLALYQILHAGDERVDGLLPQLLQTQNDPQRHQTLYESAVASLDRMLTVLGNGHRGWQAGARRM